jgi:hypothetical protein
LYYGHCLFKRYKRKKKPGLETSRQ